jgi:hypothetical protein
MASEEAFGHSLALVDGDIVLDDDAASGVRRLRVIANRPNLLQALQLRILTPFGSDPFNVTYGLDVRQAFTQPGSVRMVKELIKLNLVRTLGTDKRVRDVREVLFSDDPGFTARHRGVTEATLRDERHRRFWQVEVILDTAAGDATLSAAVGV